MKKNLKYIIAIAIIIIAGTIFYNKVYIPKSTYKKAISINGDINLSVFGIGNVGAKNIYSINSLTSGRIANIYYEEGDWVKKGDLLVSMDVVDLPKIIKQAKLSVQKAKMELNASLKNLNAQYAQQNLLSTTYKRYKKLKEQAFISQAEYDKAKTDLEVIKAQISATKAHINSSKNEILRAKENVNALKIKLSKYKIYSPTDGYIISKNVQVAQSVVPTQAILKIVNPKDVWIKAYIDERISGDIKVGQKTKITLRSQANKKYNGYVKQIAAQSDAVTQEREVDVSFEKLPIPFYINEQAEVVISTKSIKNITKIPLNAITQKDGINGVWIDKNQKASFHKIELIATENNSAAVKGIAPNEVIIIPQKEKRPLYNGAKIH